MKPIATMTVVRGSGEIEAIMNGILNQEIKRLREKELAEMEARRKEFEKEMEWMIMIKKQRDRDRVRRLKENYTAIPVQPRKERAKEKIGFVLACLLCWGEALHIIQYVGNEEE